MGKKNRDPPGAHDSTSDSEFPLLASLQLYAANTTGDGNCLFRAFSDQLYGDESHYAKIRSQALSYIKTHRERFEAFVGEFGETFDAYTKRLSQDAVYGGHLEIVAVAEQFAADIAIYQADSMYAVQPIDSTASKTLHIAYHTWEHYSSVRNKAGPHSGPPQVVPIANGKPTATKNGSSVPRWKIEIVLRSCPDVAEDKIVTMLKTKDYGHVIEELLMAPYEEPEPQEPPTPPQPMPSTLGDISGDPETAQAHDEKAKKRPTAREKRDAARKRALDRKLNKHKRKATGKTASGGEESTAPAGSGLVDMSDKTIFI